MQSAIRNPGGFRRDAGGFVAQVDFACHRQRARDGSAAAIDERRDALSRRLLPIPSVLALFPFVALPDLRREPRCAADAGRGLRGSGRMDVLSNRSEVDDAVRIRDSRNRCDSGVRIQTGWEPDLAVLLRGVAWPGLRAGSSVA